MEGDFVIVIVAGSFIDSVESIDGDESDENVLRRVTSKVHSGSS